MNGISDAAALSMDLATIARDAVHAAAPAIEPPTPTPERYRPLLGVYARVEMGSIIRLEWRDGELVFTHPDDPAWRPTLTPTDDPDVFVVQPGLRPSGERAIFRRLPDGRVSSVLLAAATYVRFGPVTGS